MAFFKHCYKGLELCRRLLLTGWFRFLKLNFGRIQGKEIHCPIQKLGWGSWNCRCPHNIFMLFEMQQDYALWATYLKFAEIKERKRFYVLLFSYWIVFGQELIWPAKSTKALKRSFAETTIISQSFATIYTASLNS